jgi:hypothetical protein
MTPGKAAAASHQPPSQAHTPVLQPAVSRRLHQHDDSEEDDDKKAEGGTEANFASASSRGRGNLQPSQESHEAEDAMDPAGLSPDWDPEADYGLSDGEEDEAPDETVEDAAPPEADNGLSDGEEDEASDETVEETATPEETAVPEVKEKRPLPRPLHRTMRAPPPTKARPVPRPPAPPLRPQPTMRTPSRSPTTRQHDAVDVQQKKQRK